VMVILHCVRTCSEG